MTVSCISQKNCRKLFFNRGEHVPSAGVQVVRFDDFVHIENIEHRTELKCQPKKETLIKNPAKMRDVLLKQPVKKSFSLVSRLYFSDL